VSFHYVQPASSLPPDLPKILYLLYAPFKAIWLALNLFFILLTLPQCDYFLLQNPPAIPTLLITKLVSYFKGVKLIIDWHNLGYSIMSINFGEDNKLVKLAKWWV
jgi:beta-1,4-mannosyltransferase